MTDLHDATSIVIHATRDQILDFLGDVREMTTWSLGTWTIRDAGGGLHEGRSLFDGAAILFRSEIDRSAGSIRWWLGQTPDALHPRIMAQVVAGPLQGSSVMTLMTWRLPGMDDDRWRRIRATHELEVCVIKQKIEAKHPRAG